MIDLLLPIRTLVSPVITPLTTMMRGVETFSLAASVNWARVDTVVTVPPAPPFVLHSQDRLVHRHLFCRGVSGSTHPPFWLAYPKFAASEMVALFANLAVPSSG